MIGFNHANTGALIAHALPLPLALPVSFVSHFVLDSLPHYGIPHRKRDTSRLWKKIFVVDFIVTLGLAALAIIWRRYDMLIGGIVGVSPDFFWVARVVRSKSFNLSKPTNAFARWHASIQHYERPWGIYMELPLAFGLFYLFCQVA